MSLRFIIGRAGSGKTFSCLEEIRRELRISKEGNNLILLVPEQATFLNEMELARTPDLQGMIRAQVFSFRRLAWRVLQEVGGGTRMHIDDLGKRMIIRQFLEKHKDKLKIFTSTVDRPGFVDKVAQAISEFKSYQIDNESLENLLNSFENKDSLLASKLNDLQIIYYELEKYLQNSYTDPDDYLNLLANRLHNSPTVIGAEVWIDGFNGFTPQELRVVEKLLLTTKRVNITITLDPDDLNLQDLSNRFLQNTFKTYSKIKELADINNITMEEPLLLKNNSLYRFRKSSELVYLEQNFFNFKAPRVVKKEIEDIKIFCGQNYRAEVEGVAREIRNLVRQEGYKYREIGVFLRNFNDYDLLIETIFPFYDIPFFIDRKHSIMHHPLVELIRSALEIVQDGWNYERVFRYLKTDLIDITREEVDLLENYCLAYGIRGKKWYSDKPWKIIKEEYQEINQIREKAIKELKEFYFSAKECNSGQDIAEVIYQLLRQLNVPNKLENWYNKAEKQGLLKIAREHSQIWDGIIDILNQLAEILGKEEIKLASIAKIIDVGLENLKLGLIPPGLDQVVVGSLERSRNPDLKVVFVMGVSEGIFPGKALPEGLFNDLERDLLKDMGITLAPTSREKVMEEEFLVYISLTRARNKLYLSYPLANEEGKALRPSLIINRLKELLPNIKEDFISICPQGDEQDINFVIHPKRSLGYLGAKIRQLHEGIEINPLWLSVYNWFLSNTAEYGDQLENIVQGYMFDNKVEKISPKIAKKLFGNPLKVSVSRLERYFSCPFSHYLAHGLRLKEREEFKLSRPDLGKFFHKAMERFARLIYEKKMDWGDLNSKQCKDLVNIVVEGLIPEMEGDVLSSSARYRYLTGKFRNTLQRSVTVLREHASRGKFRPIGLELNFGQKNSSLPGIKFSLEDGTVMELVGQIDRVDAYLEDENCYIRVIDYKSGTAGLSLLEVYYGFKIQLLTYLDILLANITKFIEAKKIIPAGIFYFYLRNPIISTNAPMEEEQIAEAILKDLKMNGYSLADLNVFRFTDNKTISGFSPLLTIGLNKKGKETLASGNLTEAKQIDMFDKRSKIFTLEQIDILRKHIRNLIFFSGQGIVQGNVSISPYQLKDFTACQYCSFLEVCQFDPELNSYRMIQEMKDDEIWGKLNEDGEVKDALLDR